MSPESSSLRQALRDALPGAMKAKDTPARNAIRSALAAIENAEAVAPAEHDPVATSAHVSSTLVGLGAGDGARRELADERILEIVTSERDERLAAATDYRKTGVIGQAERLEAEAAALDAFLC